ncbi:MAG: hypothetical protein KGJ13_02340 [Patescibacteria group bacterium]|nr:hypothetical protein [Patescibacteria group bacterium]
MNELMRALTRLANATAAYLEKQTGVQDLPFDGKVAPMGSAPREGLLAVKVPPATIKEIAPEVLPSAPEKPARKKRAPKESGAVAQKPETPQETFLRLNETVKAYCKRFNRPRAGDTTGKPEGFWHVRELIEKEYHAASMKDLSQEQQNEVNDHLLAVIAQADKGNNTLASAAAIADPEAIGV